MRATTLGGILLASCVVACFVSRPTEDLVCSSTADCTGLSPSRVCTGGYCVAPNCPADCTSCDEVAHTCQVDCTSANDCAGTITCPGGWTCTVSCTGAGACNDVECDARSFCNITCMGDNSCGDVRCSQACKCDLACQGAACGSKSCPVRGNGGMQVLCTVDGTSNTECDSARDTRCAGC